MIARVGLGRRRGAAVPRAAADGVRASRAHLRVSLDTPSPNVRSACSRTSARCSSSRGVVQISGYIDQWLASVSAATAWSRCSATRRRSTCCRSACSAWRSRRPSCRRCRATIGSEERDRARSCARGSTPALRADRVLRRSVGGGVPRARRRDRGAAVPARRPVHRDRTRCYTWGILAGSAVGLLASDAGPPVLVDVLRAARHANAAAVRAGPRRADDRARLSLRVSAAAAARHRPALGRGRAHRVRWHRGLGRVLAAARAAQSRGSARPGLPRRLRRRRCGARRSSPASRRLGRCACCARAPATFVARRSSSLGAFGARLSGARRSRSAFPRRVALVGRVRRR